MVVRRAYRGSSVVRDLIRFEFEYLVVNQYEYLFTTGMYPRPGLLYMRWFGLERYGEPFRYHPDDAEEVYLFVISRQKMADTVARLDASKSVRAVALTP